MDVPQKFITFDQLVNVKITFSIYIIIYNFSDCVVGAYPGVTPTAVRNAMTQKIKDEKEAFIRKRHTRGRTKIVCF